MARRWSGGFIWAAVSLLSAACVPPSPGGALLGLGLSKESAAEVCFPIGERAYLEKLRCSNGSPPKYRRSGSVGRRNVPKTPDETRAADAQVGTTRALPSDERDFHTIDAYVVECPGNTVTLYLDMYHCNSSTYSEAPPGFTMVQQADVNFGPARVKGRLRFDGKAMETSVVPQVWIHDEAREVGATSARIDTGAGSFEIIDLPPGRYTVLANLDLNQKNTPGMPGDLHGHTMLSVKEGSIAEIKIDMFMFMRLSEPLNTDAFLERQGYCNEIRNSYQSPLRIVWDRVTEGAYYDYRIDKLPCLPPNKDGQRLMNFREAAIVATGTTQDNLVSILLPSGGTDVFLLTLSARKNGRKVGELHPRGADWTGFDYRFRVK